MKNLNIAIVGATGLVGRTFLDVMAEMDIPVANLYLYASKKSAGKEVQFQGKTFHVEELNISNIINKDIDFVLLSAGGNVSLQYVPIFKSIGATCIDNTSAFRMNQDVPLVVPEVNMFDAYAHVGVIANPNCSTIQSVVPLGIIQKEYGLRSVRYTTLQAVSGSGQKGLDDYFDTLNGNEPTFYPYPIHNNVLPHIDDFLDNGYTKEEMKMINETRKILMLPDLDVTATCIRVPVQHSHSVEIHIELEKEFDVDTLRKQLSMQPGIVVLDKVEDNIYPVPMVATGTNDVYVGRIRKDMNHPRRLHLFVVADNVRKGAATNAVQIMKELMRGVV